MIDLHTHILPCMDDGSASVKESLQMLATEYNQGIHRVALTPHFYAEDETPEMFLQRREKSYQELQKAMQQEKGFFPEIHLGAEVRYYEGISQSKELIDLKIQGSNLLLLEMPFAQWNDRMLREVYSFQQRLGVQVVLAHIERYLKYQNQFLFWKKIEVAELLVQSNANFFIQKNSRRKALNLFKKGRIHLLGSDCHNCSVRSPNLGEAVAILEEQLGASFQQWIVEVESKTIYQM